MTKRESYSFALGKQIDAMALVKDLADFGFVPDPAKATVALDDFVRRAQEILNRKMRPDR